MSKIITLQEVQKVIRKLRTEKKIIVLAGGCFDILHRGHFEFLKAAKKEGDILIVALESDERVTHLKGAGRPINKMDVRAKNLVETNLIDYVITLPLLHGKEDYLEMVKIIKPDVIAITKGDPKTDRKKEQAELVGGKVKEVIERLPGFSTTEILKKL